MKKLHVTVLALIMALALCLSLTACSGKTVEQLQNEFGAVLQGGKFEEGSVLNFDKVDNTSEKAKELFEKLDGIGVEITDASKVYIYDISVTKGGKEVQPNGKVKLTVPMPQDGAETNYSVYHAKNSGELEKISATYADGKLTFETDSFSYYIFVGKQTIMRYNHTLTVTVDPTEAGYIEIDGEKRDASAGISLNAGKNYTLKAVENEGWSFVGWYDATSDELLAQTRGYDLYLNSDRTLAAKFKKADISGDITRYDHTLTVTVDPTEAGYIEIDGEKRDASAGISLNAGKHYTLKAVANKGWSFAGWYDATSDEMLAEEDGYDLYLNSDHRLIAKFKEAPYELTIDCNGGGNVELGGTQYKGLSHVAAERGASVTLEAVAWEGYEFVGWYDTATSELLSDSASYTLTMDGDKAVEARFKLAPANVLITVDPEGSGYLLFDGKQTTEIDEQMDIGETIEITAEPRVGYKFLYWKDVKTGERVYEETLTLAVTDAGLNYCAVFGEIPNQLFVRAETAGGGIGGRFSVFEENGTHACDSVTEFEAAYEEIVTVRVVAMEEEGYRFAGWFNEENDCVSELPEYELQVIGKVDLRALFVKAESVNQLSVSAVTLTEEGGGGTISVIDDFGSFECESVTEYTATYENVVTVKLLANAKEGYRFAGWFNGQNQCLSEETTYEVQVFGKVNLRAVFIKDEYAFYAAVLADTGGYITENGQIVDLSEGKMFPVGTKITLTAVANDGYVFVGWKSYVAGSSELEFISSEATCEFTLDRNQYVYACFEKIPTTVFFAQTSHGGERGYLLENGQVVEFDAPREVRVGTIITLTAVPNEGYRFKGWADATLGGEVIFSTSETYEFTVTTATIVTAVFEKIPDSILTVTVEPQEGGYITVDGQTVDYSNGASFEFGASVTLEAVAQEDYAFVGWYDTATYERLSDSASYTVTMDGDKHIEACFSRRSVGVHFEITPEGSGYFLLDGKDTTEIDDKMDIDETVEITAVSRVGYEFLYWEDMNTGMRFYEENLTIIVPENGLNYCAVFEEIPNQLFVRAETTGGGIGGRFSVIKEDDTLACESVTMFEAAYDYPATVQVVAMEEKGYRFVGWFNEENECLSEYPEYELQVLGKVNLRAVFEKDVYSFTASVSPAEGGYLTENGVRVEFTEPRTVDANTEISLTAVANEGYAFVGWYENGVCLSTEASYVGYVYANTQLEARFAKYCTIFVSVDPMGSGYITENGETVDYSTNGKQIILGESLELTAEPLDGYRFIGWYDDATGEMVMEDNVLFYSAEGDCRLIAKFEEIPYTLELNVDGNGSIIFNETTITGLTWEEIERDVTVTLTAVAEEGYTFVGWYDRATSELLSESESYTFTMNGNKYIEARFKHDPVKVSITATPEGSGYFEIFGGSTCTEIDEKMEVGETIEIIVVANFGYEFLYWEDMDTGMRFYEEYLTRIVPEEGLNYRAVFEEIPYCLSVTAVTLEKEGDGGTISVINEYSGMIECVSATEYKNAYKYVATLRLEANAKEGYRFTGWFDEHGCVSEEMTYEVQVLGKVNLRATFMKDEYAFYADVLADAGGYITENGQIVDLSGGKMFPTGTKITLTAVANDGYVFVGWKGYVSGSTEAEFISSEATYEFTIDRNQLVYACFEKIPTTVFFAQTSHGGECGYLLENGQAVKFDAPREVRVGTIITLTAVPKEGYRFKGWADGSVGGEVIFSTSETYEFTVTTATIVTAVFEKIPDPTLTVTVDPQDGGYITVDGQRVDYSNGASIERDTSVTLTAVAQEGYTFVGWYDKATSERLTESASYTVTMDGDKAVEARFKHDPVKVSITATPEGSGYFEILGGSTYTEIDEHWELGVFVEIKAVANVGYKFLYWEDMDTGEVYDGENFVFEAIASGVNYRAVFEEIPHQLVVSTLTLDGGDGGMLYVFDKQDEEHLYWIVSEYKNAYDAPTRIKIEAAANEGYRFAGWYNGKNECLSSNPSYTVTVDGKVSLRAVFVKDEYYFSAGVCVTGDGSASEAGYITENGQIVDLSEGKAYPAGTKFNLTAVAKEGYVFVGWKWKAYSGSGDYELVSTDPTCQFTADGDLAVIACFEKIPDPTLTVTVDPQAGGYITVGGQRVDYSNGETVAYNTSVTLTALAQDGYEFVGWFDTESGYSLSSEATYTVVMQENTNITAIFREVLPTTYRFLCDIYGNGSIWENNEDATEKYMYGATLEEGTKITLTAVADTYWQFKGWYTSDGDVLICADATYTFELTDHTCVYAMFEEKIMYTFLAQCDPYDGGYITENGQKVDFENGRMVEPGTRITLTAVANSGYTFKGWYRYDENQQEVCISSEATYDFTVDEALYVYAKFENVTVNFIAWADPSAGGHIEENSQMVEFGNGRQVVVGTKITLTAVAYESYRFKGWARRDDSGNMHIFSTEETYEFTVSEDTYVYAAFEAKVLALELDAMNAGFTDDKATVQVGAQILPKPENVLVYGVKADGNVCLSKDVDYSIDLGGLDFTKAGTYTITYIYKNDPSITATLTVEVIAQAKLTVTVTPTDGGYITENRQPVDYSNGKSFDVGSTVTLIAEENDGYMFKGWYTADNRLITQDAVCTFALSEDITAYAKFEKICVFLAQRDPYDGGYITENGQAVDFGNGRQVEAGTKITLTAVANTGYAFKGWGTRDENWDLIILSTAATYTFTVSEDTYVYAVFETKVTALELDAMNAGFTYEYPEEGDPVIADKTIVQIGAEFTPHPEYVIVYGIKSGEKVYLTKDEDYTIDLGGLDFTKEGTYTITYIYKNDPSITATLTVEVVAKPADGSLTEAEWNAAIAAWAQQTNVKVVERTVTSQSYDPQYGSMGAQIMIYQLAGTAYSEDGYMEDDELSQQYKGKMSYLVKLGDRYYKYEWSEEWNSELMEYTGKWIKEDYFAEDQYNSALNSNIYAVYDSNGDPIVFSYASFTYDAETKSYKNSDGDIAIAFTFDDSGVLTKIVVTKIVTWESGGGYTSVSTITFGDAKVDVPADAKCPFAIGVKTEDSWSEDAGYITENGEKAEYWYDYLDDGTELTLTAVANDGYVFTRWAKEVFVDGEYVWVTYSTDATYTITVDGEYGALYAVFEKVETES